MYHPLSVLFLTPEFSWQRTKRNKKTQSLYASTQEGENILISWLATANKQLNQADVMYRTTIHSRQCGCTDDSSSLIEATCHHRQNKSRLCGCCGRPMATFIATQIAAVSRGHSRRSVTGQPIGDNVNSACVGVVNVSQPGNADIPGDRAASWYRPAKRSALELSDGWNRSSCWRARYRNSDDV